MAYQNSSYRPANSNYPTQRLPEGGKSGARAKPPQEVVKTWAFDSVGNRKYALQIKKASNGNPCLKIVEGVPQQDGTFRKFDLTFWSEDWPRLFAMLDEVRAYMKEHNIKTPEGHKYDPNKPRKQFRRKQPLAASRG